MADRSLKIHPDFLISSARHPPSRLPALSDQRSDQLWPSLSPSILYPYIISTRATHFLETFHRLDLCNIESTRSSPHAESHQTPGPHLSPESCLLPSDFPPLPISTSLPEAALRT
ncbi:hypothetical protein PMIN02_007282 [Paraphaeosphaeria minitans]